MRIPKVGDCFITNNHPNWRGRIRKCKVLAINIKTNTILFDDNESPENLENSIKSLNTYWKLDNSHIIREKLGIK